MIEELTYGERLNSLSDAMNEGISILEKIEEVLKEINQCERYPLTQIGIQKEKGVLHFNFHWVKLFVKFSLIGRPFQDNRKGGIIYTYQLTWGRYELKNGYEIEKPMFNDCEVKYSSLGLMLSLSSRESARLDGDTKDKRDRGFLYRIIDQIILKCLPETVTKIEK